MATVNGFVITLKDDISEEHAEKIINAIWMLQGVINVEPNTVSPADIIAQGRAYNDVRGKLIKVLKEL